MGHSFLPFCISREENVEEIFFDFILVELTGYSVARFVASTVLTVG